MEITPVSEVKFLTRRDSATTILRKMGVPSTDYAAFIDVTTEGRFACQITKAQMYVKTLNNPVIEAKVEETPRGGPVTIAPKEDQPLAKYAKELILNGHTNDQIWEAFVKYFNLDNKKRGYPSWYRFQLRKQGLDV